MFCVLGMHANFENETNTEFTNFTILEVMIVNAIYHFRLTNDSVTDGFWFNRSCNVYAAQRCGT